MANVSEFSIDELRKWFLTDPAQNEIDSFVQSLRTEVGNREGWVATCEEAEEAANAFGPETLFALLARLEPYIFQTPPGHDQNHKYRDMLAALALVNSDLYVASARYRSDVVAGLVAGSFHDIGTSFVPRYQDNLRKVSHAEAGGWQLYQLVRDLLGEPLAKLVCYGVFAHIHDLKPIEIKLPNGLFVRQPYWDETWVVDGKPVGLAYRITRFADRLDTNGIMLFARHLLALVDASEEGGQDLSGDQFFEIKGENILRLLKPAVFGTGEKGDPPTTLKHIRNFADSNFDMSTYSQHDGNYRVMVQLLLSKVYTTRELVRIVTQGMHDSSSFSEPRTRALIKSTLRQISGSPFFERTWKMLRDKSWFTLTPEEQAPWQAGFVYVQKTYIDLIMELSTYASRNEAYKLLVEELVERCL